MKRAILPPHFESYINTYTKRMSGITWAPAGILTSEGFALCAIAKLLSIDILIESGVYHARSTQIWAECLPNVTIHAIDTKIRPQAKKRLAPYKNTHLRGGDGRKVVLDIVKNNPNKSIGIFLDGPKGKPAISIAQQAFQYPNVYFAGIHDMHQLGRNGGKPGQERTDSTSRIAFDAWKHVKFTTDEQWFIDKYKYLDAEDRAYDRIQDIRWTPHQYVNKHGKPKRKLGSYGPTIGFAFTQHRPLPKLL